MGHAFILFLYVSPDQAAETDFGDVLESPSGEEDVSSVEAVRIFVIEDGEDRVRGFVDRRVLRDVDPVVCIGCEDVCPLWIKGTRAAVL